MSTTTQTAANTRGARSSAEWDAGSRDEGSTADEDVSKGESDFFRARQVGARTSGGGGRKVGRTREAERALARRYESVGDVSFTGL